MSIPHDVRGGYRATRSDLRSTVAMGFVKGMLSGVGNTRLDVFSLLHRHGIDSNALGNPQARVPLAAYATLYNDVVSALEDEGFGLFAAPLRLGSFEFLCRCAISSRTLGEALDRMSRFLHLLLLEMHFHIDVAGPNAQLIISESDGATWESGDPRRIFAFEWLLRLLHGLACWLVGRSLPLSRVDFPYPEPHYANDYLLIYTAQPHFRNGREAVATFTANLLDLPVRRDDLALEAFLEGAPGKIATLYRRDRLVVRQVRDLLASALPESIQLDYVAAQLNLSTRSLHRKLQDEGSSFRVIKDALRRDLALARVEKPIDSLTDIASGLGYSDFSAFFRAFKSWTGMAPSEYRAMKNLLHREEMPV